MPSLSRGSYQLTLTLLIALTITACSGGDANRTSASEQTVIRDSAGVTIVENGTASSADVAAWSVDSTPAVTIGVSTGGPAYEFTTIGALRQLPNGMLLVLNGQGESVYEFRFYDSTGSHIATHGTRGQGPGEHRWINFFGSVGGDTIVGVDFPNNRLSWVSASAGFLRSSRLDENEFRKVLGDGVSGVVETMVPLGDSLYAVKAFRSLSNVRNPFERATSFHLVDLARDTALDLARYDPPPATAVRIAGRDQHIRPRGAGEPLHVVDRARHRICAGITTVAELTCVDRDGRRRIIRWVAAALPYTDADHRAFEEDFRSMRLRSSRLSAADVEAMLGAMGRPERHPIFTVLQLDADGNFWILEQALDDAKQRRAHFRVLDPDGRLIAFAESFPMERAGFGYAIDIGTRSVARMMRDADGVQTVGVFRIRKPG